MLTAHLHRTLGGTRVPTLVLDAPKEMHFREMRGALLELAAAAERASVGQRWAVVVHHNSIHIEVVDDTDAEVKAAMSLLGHLAQDLRPVTRKDGRVVMVSVPGRDR